MKHLVSVILPCLIISILIQVFVSHMIIRLLLGGVIVLAYLLLSYLVTPVTYRVFFFRHANQILKRIGYNGRMDMIPVAQNNVKADSE